MQVSGFCVFIVVESACEGADLVKKAADSERDSMKAIQKMSGKTLVRPSCSIERDLVRADEDHEDRLEELRYKAVVQLRSEGIIVLPEDISQVGQEGFHYVLGHPWIQIIPKYEMWAENTRIENRRIFNASV